MRRDPRTYLWDALRAVELLADFSSGKSFADYLADAMLRSAVERQFEIVGEALNNLSKVSPELADAIPDLPRIVAFRNILIHGYASVDDALVWQVLTDKRPQLEERLHQLLAGLE
ncbi:HepT-like ribonuclease domain-containing protein [Lentzea cavernae]|uniref:Antitoxin n=1 Tax=Lentzea cavernae TaxID=2020703 RepID=A0ABQ3ME41_9PSEU|nr:HepT-like ribonuclease domain-containing protein [Lentzea cavernae]GHH38244.1 antitoxin [Lentzea cavernae]